MKTNLQLLKNRLKQFKLKKAKLKKLNDYYCILVQVDLSPLKFIKIQDFQVQEDYIFIRQLEPRSTILTISHSNCNNFKILEDTPTLQVLYSKIPR